MVRCGLALYGYHLPFVSPDNRPAENVENLPLEPILTWKTRLIEVKEVGPGHAVGYGGNFVTRQPSRLAILAVGYADGFSRLLSRCGRVIVRDQYAPIAGNISMDLTAIDITHIPDARLGDEVTILGTTGGCCISAWEHADLTNTIPYEVLCSIGRRVPRLHLD